MADEAPAPTTIVATAQAPVTPAAEAPKSPGEVVYGAEPKPADPVPAKDTPPAADAPPAEQKPAVEEKPADGEVKPEGDKDERPANWDLKLPDTFTADEATLNAFKDMAKADKLTPEQAQKYVDLAAKVTEAQQSAIMKNWADVNKTWQDATLALPEFAPDRRETTLQVIGQMIDEFGTPQVREALEVTGAGNHPAIAAFIYNMAHALTEGEPAPQGKPAVAKKATSPGQMIYGNKYDNPS